MIFKVRNLDSEVMYIMLDRILFMAEPGFNNPNPNAKYCFAYMGLVGNMAVSKDEFFKLLEAWERWKKNDEFPEEKHFESH